jgi:hypothetical protein
VAGAAVNAADGRPLAFTVNAILCAVGGRAFYYARTGHAKTAGRLALCVGTPLAVAALGFTWGHR